MIWPIVFAVVWLLVCLICRPEPFYSVPTTAQPNTKYELTKIVCTDPSFSTFATIETTNQVSIDSTSETAIVWTGLIRNVTATPFLLSLKANPYASVKIASTNGSAEHDVVVSKYNILSQAKMEWNPNDVRRFVLKFCNTGDERNLEVSVSPVVGGPDQHLAIPFQRAVQLTAWPFAIDPAIDIDQTSAENQKMCGQ